LSGEVFQFAAIAAKGRASATDDCDISGFQHGYFPAGTDQMGSGPIRQTFQFSSNSARRHGGTEKAKS
jgi:hypothetical protein